VKARQLIEAAEKKVGGPAELARRMDWKHGPLTDAREGRRPLPPYRAAQLAEIIGSDPKSAYLAALQEKAESDGERKLLGELLASFKAAGRVLTIALALYAVTFLESKPALASTVQSSGENIHY